MHKILITPQSEKSVIQLIIYPYKPLLSSVSFFFIWEHIRAKPVEEVEKGCLRIKLYLEVKDSFVFEVVVV